MAYPGDSRRVKAVLRRSQCGSAQLGWRGEVNVAGQLLLPQRKSRRGTAGSGMAWSTDQAKEQTMGKFMQQQVKRQSTAEVEVEEVPTEVNEQSAEVSEDACCVLNEIDDLLKEIDEPKEWDPATAPKPDWDRDYNKRYDQAQTWDERSALVAEYREHMQQWHDARGLSYNPCTC